MSIVSGVISILDWVKDKLPIQDRKERWKNQLAELKQEKTKLLKGDCNEKKAIRLINIDIAIDKLNRLLENSTGS